MHSWVHTEGRSFKNLSRWHHTESGEKELYMSNVVGAWTHSLFKMIKKPLKNTDINWSWYYDIHDMDISTLSVNPSYMDSNPPSPSLKSSW